LRLAGCRVDGTNFAEGLKSIFDHPV
jgi:hypothetical protein